MKTREVFRILSDRLEPVLLPVGFSQVKDRTGQFKAWSRTFDEEQHETVWCQVDKFHWDPWIGSKFGVEFQQASTKEAGAVKGAKRARLADLLTNEERHQVQIHQNRVVEKFRVPSVEEYSKFMGFTVESNEWFMNRYHEGCRPLTYAEGLHKDIWLLILDAQDVMAWGEFLAVWLLGALERFAKLSVDGVLP